MAGVTPLIVAPFHFNEYLDRLPSALVRRKKGTVAGGQDSPGLWIGRVPRKNYCARFQAGRCAQYVLFPEQTSHRRPRNCHHLRHDPREVSPALRRERPYHAMEGCECGGGGSRDLHLESTRRDVLATYDIPEERVSVTHLGFDPLGLLLTGESSSDFKVRVLGADAPYFLYVGSRVNYKNFGGLLEAYSASASLRKNFSLLCFGGGDFTGAERAAIAKAGVEGRVIYLGGPDAVLAACYAHASFIRLPVVYEGFGIPVLEAMSLECPVACSNSSSLPEVVGDAATLFDPRDRDSIRSALESVLDSPSAATALKERGRIRRQLFSWRSCAENTIGIYRRVLNS